MHKTMNEMYQGALLGSGVVLVKILPGNIDLSKIEDNVLCRSVGYKQLPCDVLYGRSCTEKLLQMVF
jgi:hypothetical protein